MTRIITLAMAVYGQPKMLEVWFETLRRYTPEMLESLELLIVDDCGEPAAEIPADIQAMLPCQLLRVTENIPWNQPGARNLALDHCNTDLVLFVDPDMVFPPAMMEDMILFGERLELGNVIRFQLKHRKTGALDPSSPNTWFLHVSDFLAVGGYDEDYAGHKGWSDVQLLDVMTSHYKIHHEPGLHADFYDVGEIPDAMVTTLERSHKHNRHQRLLKVKEARMMGGWKQWVKIKRKRIRFGWERKL